MQQFDKAAEIIRTDTALQTSQKNARKDSIRIASPASIPPQQRSSAKKRSGRRHHRASTLSADVLASINSSRDVTGRALDADLALEAAAAKPLFLPVGNRHSINTLQPMHKQQLRQPHSIKHNSFDQFMILSILPEKIKSMSQMELNCNAMSYLAPYVVNIADAVDHFPVGSVPRLSSQFNPAELSCFCFPNGIHVRMLPKAVLSRAESMGRVGRAADKYHLLACTDESGTMSLGVAISIMEKMPSERSDDLIPILRDKRRVHIAAVKLGNWWRRTLGQIQNQIESNDEDSSDDESRMKFGQFSGNGFMKRFNRSKENHPAETKTSLFDFENPFTNTPSSKAKLSTPGAFTKNTPSNNAMTPGKAKTPMKLTFSTPVLPPKYNPLRKSAVKFEEPPTSEVVSITKSRITMEQADMLFSADKNSATLSLQEDMIREDARSNGFKRMLKNDSEKSNETSDTVDPSSITQRDSGKQSEIDAGISSAKNYSGRVQRLAQESYEYMLQVAREGDVCLVPKCYIFIGVKKTESLVLLASLQQMVYSEREVGFI